MPQLHGTSHLYGSNKHAYTDNGPAFVKKGNTTFVMKAEGSGMSDAQYDVSDESLLVVFCMVVGYV